MWKKQKEIDKYTLNIIFFAKISLLVSLMVWDFSNFY